jgi:serine protease Do
MAGMPTAARAANGDDTGWLGVYTQELSPELEEALNHHGDAVLVTRAVANSPADRAGLRKGDLIVRVNSKSVGSPTELARAVQSFSPGDEVEIQIVRDGERRTLSPTLARRNDTAPKKEKAEESWDSQEGKGSDYFKFEMPPGATAPDAPSLFNMGVGGVRLGVRIETLNPDLGEYFDIRDGQGVLVLDVIKDTPADKIGIRGGDVIIRIDDRDINDSDDLIKSVAEAEGTVQVTVVRHGSRKTFETELKAVRAPRVMRLERGPNWRFDGNSWRKSGQGGQDREAMEKELTELRQELKELKQDLEELRER